MSSLLQFNGRVDSKGVHIQAYKVDSEPWYQAKEEFLFFCPKCKRQHPRLFIFARKPRGMFGPWVVFRFNGRDQVPDLSCPIALSVLPRDAQSLSLKESMEIWHS